MTARSCRRKPKHAEPIAHERAELEARFGQVGSQSSAVRSRTVCVDWLNDENDHKNEAEPGSL